MAQGAGYTVKSVEPVAIGSDVQARVFTLAPGEAIPWHFHSTVADTYFVLEGTLSVRPGRRPIGNFSPSVRAIGLRRRPRI